MRAKRILAVSILILAAARGIALPVAGQEENAAGGFRLQVSFQADLFSRTLLWDDKTRSSRLFSPLGMLALDYEAASGLDLGILLGYSLSNWNGLTFRDLPFSLENQAGSIGGFILGAELRKSLFVQGYWELDAEARFTTDLGRTTTVPIEGLAVDGQADLKGHWMRIEAGPVLHYRGFETFSPYVGLAFDRIWGQMTATETIGDLEGTQETKVTPAGVFALNFGTVYEPSTAFRIKLGGTLVPITKVGGGLGLDYGGTIRVLTAF
jgi:hypothetical protein